MQILFLTSAFSLVTSVWSTHRLFQDIFLLEKRQIGIDNSAIILGRQDRELFRRLVRLNGNLKALEHKHHGFHSCALFSPDPKIRSVCKMKDVALESMLDRLSHLTVERERVNWISNGLAAYEEYHKTQTAYFNHLDRYSSALRISHRVLRLPVKNLVCPICTKRILWEVDLGAGKLVYQLLSSTEDLPETVNPIGVFLQLIGSSLLPGHPGSRWEYRLAIVDPNEHIKWKQIEKVSSH